MGRVTRNQVSPGREGSLGLPWNRGTTRLYAIGRPSPVPSPRGIGARNDSKIRGWASGGWPSPVSPIATVAELLWARIAFPQFVADSSSRLESGAKASYSAIAHPLTQIISGGCLPRNPLQGPQTGPRDQQSEACGIRGRWSRSRGEDGAQGGDRRGKVGAEPRRRRASAFRGIGPRPGFSIRLVAPLCSHTDGRGRRWRRPRPGSVMRGALHDDITETRT